MKTTNHEHGLPPSEGAGGPSPGSMAAHPDKVRDVERVLAALEEQQLDITAEYHVWLRLGFALAQGFGEAGRTYFHRLSRFYPNYDYRECDKQFTYCLRSRGSGVTLASFFYHAREAGIRCSGWEPDYDMDLSEDPDHFWVTPPTGEAPDWLEEPQEGSGLVRENPSGTMPSAAPTEEDLHVARLLQAWKKFCEIKGRPYSENDEWVQEWIMKPYKRHVGESVLRKIGVLDDTDPDSQSRPIQLSEVAKSPESDSSEASAPRGNDLAEELRRMEEEKWKKALEARRAPTSEDAAVKISEKISEKTCVDQRERTSPPTASSERMPCFPDSLFQQLPEFLRKAVAPAASPEERDLLLLGSIGAASACFPKLKGLYDSKEYRPNLYLFVSAQASAGKGKMGHCKQLVEPVHQLMREQAELLKLEYEQELAEYESARGEREEKKKPRRPAERMLFLPANNSAAGMIQLLAENQGQGLIFETEADTLTHSLRTDFSDYSDSFRKAFHHEGISYFRKTEREYISIDAPCLSAVITGTPKQVISLIRNVEDGLFSRFLFYHLEVQQGFKEVFTRNPHGNLDGYYLGLGQELLALHQSLQQQPDLWVELREPQVQRFYTFFRRALAKYRQLKPREYDATVHRLGLIAFRMCMLFTAFRIMEDGQIGEKRLCSDTDFESVLSMISVLIRHSSRMFSLLPEEVQLQKKVSAKEQFLESLPAEFSRKGYLELAASLKIREKTAEAYIADLVKEGLLEHPDFNRYLNPALYDEGQGRQKAGGE